MTVAKSLKNTFIQIVDDLHQQTLVGLATNSKNDGRKTERTRIPRSTRPESSERPSAQLALEKGINESSLIGIAIAITAASRPSQKARQARTGILAIYYMR